jgi:signal peptidase II
MKMRAIVLLGVLAVGVVGCDQATKQTAVHHLKGHPRTDVLGSVVQVTYAENQGAFLGLGDRLPEPARVPVLVVLNLAILAGLGLWAFGRRRSLWVHASATLIIAGGLGNIIDRVLRDGGRVVDFLFIQVGPLHTGIFNVADVALMAGVAGLLLAATRRRTGADPAASRPAS